MILNLFAALALSTGGQAADERFIPDPWIGEWNEKLEDCGTGNNDSRLRIERDRILFYESGGVVRGAFLRGPFEIVVVLDMSGEGQTWIDSHHFVMSASGTYIRTTGEEPMARYRCPRTAE